jgi:hypothetical protein
MAIERVLMVIADIGGYTRFMNLHRTSLGHAQELVGKLLEAVIRASKGRFEVAKLEGDAVFLFARIPAWKEPDLEPFTERVRLIRQKFLEVQRSLNTNRLCTCDGCTQVGQLKLKFVSHLGEAAFQKVHRFVELAGVDVILVHRMLKNSVPLREYVLMTDPVHDRLHPTLKEACGGGLRRTGNDADPLHRLERHLARGSAPLQADPAWQGAAAAPAQRRCPASDGGRQEALSGVPPHRRAGGGRSPGAFTGTGG